MPEVTETAAPPLYQIAKQAAEPYNRSEDKLDSLTKPQIQQASEIAKKATIARYPNLSNEIEQLHRFVYNVLLADEMPEATNKDKVFVTGNVHRFVHNAWFAQQDIADEAYVKTVYKVVSTTDRLVSRYKEPFNARRSRNFWSAIRAELGIVRALTESPEASARNMAVYMLDYTQDYDEKREWSNEILQVDITSGVDLIAVFDTGHGRSAVLIDCKARASMPTDPVKVELARDPKPNPLLDRLLREYRAQDMVKVIATIPPDNFVYFDPNKQDQSQPKKELIREFGKLKDEPKSAIVTAILGAIE